jgi:hypothetical protein
VPKLDTATAATAGALAAIAVLVRAARRDGWFVGDMPDINHTMRLEDENTDLRRQLDAAHEALTRVHELIVQWTKEQNRAECQFSDAYMGAVYGMCTRQLSKALAGDLPAAREDGTP